MEVNMMLAGLQTGSSVIEGRLDLYSCKLAGADKEVSKSLEQGYLDELAALDDDETTYRAGEKRGRSGMSKDIEDLAAEAAAKRQKRDSKQKKPMKKAQPKVSIEYEMEEEGPLKEKLLS